MNKFKLLIVDDEELILKSLKKFFEKKENIETIVFSNPKKALEYIEKDKVHIALLDIQMPEMNGIDMLREIKVLDPLVQVIIMTAYSSLNRILMAFELGANDYIIKPFKSLDYVGEIVEHTVKKIERWKEIFRLSVDSGGGL